MKTIVVALVYLGLALSVASFIPKPKVSVREEEEVAVAFAECVRKALDGGLASANIPNHNPLVSNRTFNLTLDLGLASANLSLSDFVIRNIVDFNITQVNGTKTPNGIFYNYSIYWDSLVTDNLWSGVVNSSILGIDIETRGAVRITLNDLVFKGIFNLTLPSEGVEEKLEDFSLDLQVSQANVSFSGISGIVDAILSQTSSLATTVLINDFFPVDSVSSALKDRLNNAWIANGSRIDAIIDACHRNGTYKLA